MKKPTALALICVLAAGLFALAGCGERNAAVDDGGHAGVYESRSSPFDYIDLNPDNTFTMVRNGETTRGSWDVEDDSLLLSAGGFSETMEIDGGIITDEQGIRYVKLP